MELDQSVVPRARRQKDLPTFYYHEHFLEMLAFVSTHYDALLAPEHRRLIAAFRELDVDEQRLYVRLVNRKGQVFDAAKLRYPELGPAAPLVESLAARGWIVRPGAEHYAAVLRFLKRAEIVDVLSQLTGGVSRATKKAELVTLALDHVRAEDFIDRVATERIVVQGHCRAIRYLLFLFFGRLQDGLSQFTLRDLGLVRVNDSRGDYEPRFAEREEAEAQFFLAEQARDVERADAAGLARMADAASNWALPGFASVARERDRVLFLLGKRLARDGDADRALQVFRLGESAECNERVARLLLANGETESAREFLEARIAAPRSDEELMVASDLYARKFGRKRTSTLTDRLREAERIELDESHMGAPERAVLAWFARCGVRGFRVENSLWRTLFGLLFWDELTGDDGEAGSSPFDFLPASVREGRFRERHATAVATLRTRLERPGALPRRLLEQSTRHYGTPNGVFRWRRETLDALFVLAQRGDSASILAMLDHLIDDYPGSRYGYPDLMLEDDDGIRFVEVKTEGDALRRNQLLRLEQLERAGFRADILRVGWVVDPAQDYVVVDVETTGGRGERHRITEIGAVRVRGGRVREEFSTLVNPQRAIPANITRLTGISAGMVADAPYFADIADELAAFLDGAVFVAHNVEFDYGFVHREFARLGRPLRMPKLCTVASMRRLYPGLESYALANLCRHFGVRLENHHRALCDARAAAELLILVNEKRGEHLAGD